jgi:hypothetical protein
MLCHNAMLTFTRWYEHDYDKPLSRMDGSNTPASHNASASSGKKKVWQLSTAALYRICFVWFLVRPSCSEHTRASSNCSERAATCNGTISLRFRLCFACTSPGFALERRFEDRDSDVDCRFQAPHNLYFECDSVYYRHSYDDKRTRRNLMTELGLWHSRLNTFPACMNNHNQRLKSSFACKV